MNSYIHYRDYVGSVEFSEEDQVFHGKVIGIKDLISFEGDSVKTLTEDFHNAVDEYMEFCEKRGKQPEKPFKGSFNVRIQPDLHRKAALEASSRGLTLNAFVEDSINRNVNT
ncbi:MAG: type II toxin-antitoxin system HicB family antitoxin [Clostridiales bacterium]|nr:type II toxin-antitoxin system HicB family antitoxin [Clostridiales bacterium]